MFTDAPTFPDSFSPSAWDILADYPAGSSVVIWREAGSPVAWSGDPATVRLMTSEARPSKVVAATLYRADSEWSWTSETLESFARLFVDDDAKGGESERLRTVSPIFGLFVQPIGRFEPWSPIARAFYSDKVAAKDDERSRRVHIFRELRRPAWGRTLPAFRALPLATVDARNPAKASPYPVRRRPYGDHGAGFPLLRKHGRTDAKGVWMENPALAGFRPVSTSAEALRLRHTGWYTGEDGGDTVAGVVLTFHGFRVPALRYSYESGPALVVLLPVSRMWESIAENGEDEATEAAARTAEHYAECVAEEERDYSEAWQKGSEVADLESSVRMNKAHVRSLFRKLAASRKTTDATTWRTFVRPMARDKARDVLAEIETAELRIEKIRGDFEDTEGFRDGFAESNY